MEYPIRKPLRLSGYNYNTPGAYFVTICVQNRHNVFWDNVGAAISRPQDVVLSPIGQVVLQAIEQVPVRYPHITIDHYCIMPDHIHLLLRIHPDQNGRQVAAPTCSVVIGHLKRYVSKQIGHSVWQKSFVDRIVRNEKGYQAIWEYIDNNPLKLDYADDFPKELFE